MTLEGSPQPALAFSKVPPDSNLSNRMHNEINVTPAVPADCPDAVLVGAWSGADIIVTSRATT
jgi:hypothetical protein